jgi:hypothetical protein
MGAEVRRAFILLAIAALAPGCDLGIGSPPYKNLGADPCLPGNVRVGSGPCQIAIPSYDAAAAAPRWADVATIPVGSDCTACGTPVPVGIRAGLYPTSVDWLVFRVFLAGGAAPSSDPTLRYVLELRAGPASRHRAVEAFVLGSTGSAWLKGGAAVTGASDATPGIDTRPDGFVVSLSRTALGFQRGATAQVRVERNDANGWEKVYESGAVGYCWGVSEGDPCRAP